jgi:ketosteroid isomerase-like protein
VRRWIEGRLSTALSASGGTDARKAPPVTVALAGIDESSQPEEMLHKVVKPLLDDGTEVEIHFSGENSPGLGLVREWLREEIQRRAEKLSLRVESVEAEESELRELAGKLARRVEPVPEVPWVSIDLQLRARAVAGAPPEVDPALVRHKLASTERKTERAWQALTRVREELESRRERHEELKGLLRGYNARARDHGLVEDEELAALYRSAAQEIAAGPCSLPLAEELVENYVRAVRRRIDGEPEAVT